MNYNSISRSVNDWRNRNKGIVPADWDRDASNRTQRFKEYGKMETDRTKYNTRNPKKPVEQIEYIQKNERNIPYYLQMPLIRGILQRTLKQGLSRKQ